MIYNTVEDIFAANDDVRRRILARVEGLGDAAHGARPAEGAWSVAEIVEHLSITERRVTHAIEGMLPKPDEASDGGAAGGANADGAATYGGTAAPSSFTPFSLDEYAEQARDRKIEAPEFIRPRGIPLADALAGLRESRAALERLRPRFHAADYSKLLTHPAFGPLNVGQWLAFVGMHEERHLAQIERTLETMK
jgi:hypothetical protein